MTAADVEPGITKTISGLRLSFLDPKPDQICIVDIARGLSNASRYSGQTLRFYSVAEHSIVMSIIVEEMVVTQGYSDDPKLLAIQSMVHDSPEAYTGDMAAPLKAIVPRFKEIEELIWRAVSARLSVPPELHPLIKTIDVQMRTGERSRLRYGLGDLCTSGSFVAKRTSELIKPLSPDEAFVQFMLRWSQLTAAP